MKEGEGAIFDDNMHNLIHLISELQKIDDGQELLARKRNSIMRKIESALNCEVLNAERDKEKTGL